MCSFPLCAPFLLAHFSSAYYVDNVMSEKGSFLILLRRHRFFEVPKSKPVEQTGYLCYFRPTPNPLSISWSHGMSLLRLYYIGQLVRALDFQFGNPEFKSRSDRYLDLFKVVPSSNPSHALWIANWFSSLGQLEFLTLLSSIWIVYFRHLLGPISISAINTAQGK